MLIAVSIFLALGFKQYAFLESLQPNAYRG